MTTLPMPHTTRPASTRSTITMRPLDLVVGWFGLTVAVCGYFAGDISWQLGMA